MDTKTIVCPSFLLFLGIGQMLSPCLTVRFFHVLLHHGFICLLKHIAVVLGRNKVYWLEITTISVHRGLNISFWKNKKLITMTSARGSRDVFSLKSSVLLCSQVLSAVSLGPTNICSAVRLF